jgi:hypothetical protein
LQSGKQESDRAKNPLPKDANALWEMAPAGPYMGKGVKGMKNQQIENIDGGLQWCARYVGESRRVARRSEMASSWPERDVSM